MRNRKLIVILTALCVLTLFIVINSVLFSVQHVNAYCYNEEDENLESEVISAADIKRGQNIFFLNEQEIIDRVESGVIDKNVKVVNIERKFPNQVYINYIKIQIYFKIHSNSKIYYLSNSGVVMRIENESASTNIPAINVKINGTVKNEKTGEAFDSSEPSDIQKLQDISSAFEMLMYRSDLFSLFDVVYLSGEHSDVKNFVYIHTVTGAYFELQSTSDAFKKLDAACVVYKNELSDAQKQSSTLILTMDHETNESKVFIKKANRFKDGIII